MSRSMQNASQRSLLCSGSLSSYSGFVLFLNKAEISLEFCCFRRVHSVQGFFCGKRMLKRDTKAVSDVSQDLVVKSAIRLTLPGMKSC
jgi:hypothetical protein